MSKGGVCQVLLPYGGCTGVARKEWVGVEGQCVADKDTCAEAMQEHVSGIFTPCSSCCAT